MLGAKLGYVARRGGEATLVPSAMVTAAVAGNYGYPGDPTNPNPSPNPSPNRCARVADSHTKEWTTRCTQVDEHGRPDKQVGTDIAAAVTNGLAAKSLFFVLPVRVWIILQSDLDDEPYKHGPRISAAAYVMQSHVLPDASQAALIASIDAVRPNADDGVAYARWSSFRLHLYTLYVAPRPNLPFDGARDGWRGFLDSGVFPVADPNDPGELGAFIQAIFQEKVAGMPHTAQAAIRSLPGVRLQTAAPTGAPSFNPAATNNAPDWVRPLFHFCRSKWCRIKWCRSKWCCSKWCRSKWCCSKWCRSKWCRSKP